MSMNSIRVNDQIAKFFGIELDNRLHLNGREKISIELSERTAANRSLSSKANRSPLNENWNTDFQTVVVRFYAIISCASLVTRQRAIKVQALIIRFLKILFLK